MDRWVLAVLAAFVLIAALGFGLLNYIAAQGKSVSYTARERGFEEVPSRRSFSGSISNYTLAELEVWQRPAGPYRVGIQAGHWRVDEVPDELAELKLDGTGAEGGGVTELAVVLEIAGRIKEALEASGILVDILPATVPPGYVADAFVALHADSNSDAAIAGRKVVSPRRDYSGQSIFLEEFLREEYEKATGITRDPAITRTTVGYYAFNWHKYQHAYTMA